VQARALATDDGLDVVDNAVAVVVLTVAHLHLGQSELSCTDELAAGVAREGSGGSADTEPSLARPAQLGEGFVDCTVAVVVDPVADLTLSNGLGLASSRHASGARIHRNGARSGAAGDLGQVVDGAIAVVVDAITSLAGGSQKGIAALGDTFDAGGLGVPAGADPTHQPVQLLVDLSVAVVIAAITDFGRGAFEGHARLHHRVDTKLDQPSAGA
jgi:hypothetical protein